eukprot:g3565.t1
MWSIPRKAIHVPQEVSRRLIRPRMRVRCSSISSNNSKSTSKNQLRSFSSAWGSTPPVQDAVYDMFHDSHDMDEAFVGKTGAEIFHDLLVRHGVDQVFGYPGGAILPVYDAIYESPHFKFVLPRHEQGGGHMAEGYARVTGKPGVVLVTSGPGATNMVTPLQDALMDGVPLVVFTGQVPTVALGTDAFQEADVVGITRSCTKWNTLVKDIRDLPRTINEAFYIATSGRPGPVLVDLPKDVTAGVLNVRPDSMPRIASRMVQKSKHETLAMQMGGDAPGQKLEEVLRLIFTAKKPLIYAGQGVLQGEGGVELLRELAHKAQIPVTTTLQGMGAFDELDPLSLHMLGMHGSAYANYAMQDADLILAIGARFDDRVTGNVKEFAPKAFAAAKERRGGIVHFEISPKNISKVVIPTLAIVGDLADSLRTLLPLVKSHPFVKSDPSDTKSRELQAIESSRAEWFGRISEWKEKHPFRYEAASGGLIKPQQVLESFYKQTAHRTEDVVYTTGVGQHQMWAAQYIRWRHPRSMITSGGSGTMGFGLPAAIGAKLGAPDKMVVDIDGDASYSMTCQELLTAVQYNIGVKVLVLNNNFQGMVRQWQDLFYDKRYSQTEMFNPCFAELANAMGAKGLKVSREEDLEQVLEEFIAYDDGPVVLDAVCEKDEHVYPMVPAGAALHEMKLGTSEYKG